MQTRHPKTYGPSTLGQTPSAIFVATEAGLTLRSRPVLPAPFQAFKSSSRGGVCANLGVAPAQDAFFIVSPVTGGITINLALLADS